MKPGRPSDYSENPELGAVIALNYGIAHDLNNMLGVIAGNTEMVLAGDVEDEQSWRHCLEQVMTACEQAEHLLGQLPLEAPGSKQQVRLGSLIKGVLHLLQEDPGDPVHCRYRITPRNLNVPLNLARAYTLLVQLFRQAQASAGAAGQLEVLMAERSEAGSSCIAEISVSVPGGDATKGPLSRFPGQGLVDAAAGCGVQLTSSSEDNGMQSVVIRIPL